MIKVKNVYKSENFTMKDIKNYLYDSVRCSKNGVVYPQLYVKEVNLLVELIGNYNKLKKQLKLCKIIILLLLAFILFPMFEKMEQENIEILKSSENLEKELITEAKKIHEFNKLGFNYVYDFEI